MLDNLSSTNDTNSNRLSQNNQNSETITYTYDGDGGTLIQKAITTGVDTETFLFKIIN